MYPGGGKIWDLENLHSPLTKTATKLKACMTNDQLNITDIFNKINDIENKIAALSLSELSNFDEIQVNIRKSLLYKDIEIKSEDLIRLDEYHKKVMNFF